MDYRKWTTIVNMIIHWTRYLFSDWPKGYSDFFLINLEPRVSLFSSLVVERETLVGPAHVTTQNLGGKTIGWQRGVAKSRNCSISQNGFNDPPSLWYCCFYWSRDQVNQGLSLDDKGVKEREPGFEVVFKSALVTSYLQIKQSYQGLRVIMSSMTAVYDFQG